MSCADTFESFFVDTVNSIPDMGRVSRQNVFMTKFLESSVHLYRYRGSMHPTFLIRFIKVDDYL